jgi:hypothetical protein
MPSNDEDRQFVHELFGGSRPAAQAQQQTPPPGNFVAREGTTVAPRTSDRADYSARILASDLFETPHP